MYKPIVVTDRNGNQIGTVEGLEIELLHGQYRSASSVFVCNELGEILIQKRSKYINYPGKLDKSVGGHVDEGETFEEVATREMREELGLQGVELKKVVHGHIFGGYIVHAYTAVITKKTPIHFDEHEVESVIWLSPEEINRQVQNTPEIFTDNFVDWWNTYRDTIVAS